MNRMCNICKTRLNNDNSSPSVLVHGGMCRECRRKYYVDHKEHIVKIKKEYRDTHKEERKEYLSANKEQISRRTSIWSKSIKGRHARVRYLLKKEGIGKSDSLWSINYYAEIIRDNKCHYCLNDLNSTGTALDAMNNEDGHTCFNVVPCCWPCNIVKMDNFTYGEMMLLSPVLRIIKQQRGEN